MKHFESVKRIIILQLAVIGLLMQTIAYVYVWRTVYNDIMQKYMWRNFTGRGFWLLAAVYTGTSVVLHGHIWRIEDRVS